MHDNKEALMKYRMDMARDKLRSAKILLDSESYKDSISRSYYAMFTAVRAILAVDEVDFKKHAGVISYFQREYIKTGKFDKRYSKYLSNAFRIRNDTDYADFYIVKRQDAEEQYERAVELLRAIEEYLSGH